MANTASSYTHFFNSFSLVLGILILFYLTDRPHQARWLTEDERTALEDTLAREKHEHKRGIGHLTVGQALANPKVLALAAAYYFVVTGSYGVELYMASIVKDWYGIKDVKEVAYLIIIPAIGALIGVPAGIVLGRWLWNEFAHQIHVVPEPTVPTITIVLIAVAALLLANVVAAIPGRQAARTQTAVLLRAE